MNRELAEHVSLLAAPIYAGFLSRAVAARTDNEIGVEILNALRRDAITQARALWLQTLDTKEL